MFLNKTFLTFYSVIVSRATSVAPVIKSNDHVRIIPAKVVANALKRMENSIAGMNYIIL